MIVMLDDIGRAMYKKLKAESDSLLRIQGAIKSKRRMVASMTESWLELEKLELDEDADRMYHQKCKAEQELRQLELSETASLERIKKYARKKA